MIGSELRATRLAQTATPPSISVTSRAIGGRSGRSCDRPPSPSTRSPAERPVPERWPTRFPVAVSAGRGRMTLGLERSGSGRPSTRTPVAGAVDPAATRCARLTAGRGGATATERSADERGTNGSAARASPPPSLSIRVRGRDDPDGASAATGDAIPGASAPSATEGTGAAVGGVDVSGAGTVGVGSGVAEGVAGCSAAGDGTDAGGGVGAGGAAGAGGGLGALRGGSSSSGSTYVSLSPTRMPRCRYGTSCSASPVGPGSAIGSPSATVAPLRTRSVPRCVREALKPSLVRIVTVRPCVGTCPANDTSPAAGARTARDSPNSMSTPRC